MVAEHATFDQVSPARPQGRLRPTTPTDLATRHPGSDVQSHSASLRAGARVPHAWVGQHRSARQHHPLQSASGRKRRLPCDQNRETTGYISEVWQAVPIHRKRSRTRKAPTRAGCAPADRILSDSCAQNSTDMCIPPPTTAPPLEKPGHPGLLVCSPSRPGAGSPPPEMASSGTSSITSCG